MKYVVVDIGCIECGEQSGVLGIFTNKKEAEKVAKKYKEIQTNNWSGQHYFEIFEVKEEDVEVYDEETYLKQCLYNLQEKYDCGGISQEEWQNIEDRFGDYLKEN